MNNKRKVPARLNQEFVQHVLFPTCHRLLLNRALSDRAPITAERVLVVGCGSDPYCELFADPDLYLCTDLERRSSRVDALADGVKLPFRSGTFDCVVATEVMEHIQDPKRFIGELHRVISPKGGVLYLSVPFIFHEHSVPHDYWRFTSYGLRLLFSQYESVSVIPLGNRLHSISDLITSSCEEYRIFLPLRLFNYVLVGWAAPEESGSHAATRGASGFLVVAHT